jgi:hypothetical protein
MHERRKLWCVAGLALLLNACSTIGPDTIARDRFDYADAIRTSWKRQMLQNIVNLRYGSPPVFIDVASIISQYELKGQVSAGASFSGGTLGRDVYNIGGNAQYSERPTITYQPLTGPKFARNLLAPVPPAKLLSLVQAGYPIEFLFGIGVKSINGVRNHTDNSMMREPADPEFDPLLAALGRIQRSGLIGLRLEQQGDDKVLVLFFGDAEAEAIRNDIEFVRNTLGLAPESAAFNLVFAHISPGPGHIAIQSRSILEILMELAAGVEVPPGHLADGRATAAVDRGEAGAALLKIRSQSEMPTEAFAAVRFKDYWFWVDDRDMRSKRMISFMIVLSSLAESDAPAQLPVVTVGAGG